ncbi:MAG: diguanylate cyclase [Trueperaceae bacterium]
MTTVPLAELNERAWARAKEEPAEALAIARDAESEARRVGDETEMGNALRTIGACHLELGEKAAAYRVLDDAIAALEGTAGVEQARTETYRLLARVCFLQQEFEQALRHVNEALKESRDVADAEVKAAVLNDAGMLHSHLGSYEQGLEYLLASLRLLEKHGGSPAGGPLNNIGNLYMVQGDAGRALEFFGRARVSFEAKGTQREKIIALANVGRALEELGQLDRALEIHEQCLRKVREANDTMYLAPTLTKYAVVLGKLGRTEEALACFGEALVHLDSNEGSFADETVHSLAELHLDIGQPEKAERLYRRALADAQATGSHQTGANACLGLAKALEALGRWREALECFRHYHEMDRQLARQLFSQQSQALLLQGELEQSSRERQLLRESNRQLSAAYEELRELHRALEEKSAELQRLSREDPLTKLFNRRELENRLREELNRLQRFGGKPFSVVMCDIDDFKVINDRHSHVVGDEILVHFSGILRGNTREIDVAARVGGEEFVLLLPETDLDEAHLVAEKVRVAVEAFPWNEVRRAVEVTLSVGVTTAATDDDVPTLLQRADENLYRAKRMGKNAVCCGPEPARRPVSSLG